MTEAQARAVANAILISAGVAAAAVVMSSPPLRRLALRAFRQWLGGIGVSAYFANEARKAWLETAPR